MSILELMWSRLILKRTGSTGEQHSARFRPLSFFRRRLPPREASLPVETRRALEQIFGAAVTGVLLIEHSRNWTFWNPGVRATTRRDLILLRGSVADFLRDPALILEEYFHVLRQWNTGEMTLCGYLCESACRGYRKNRFEIAAKDFARRRASAYADLSPRAPETQRRCPQ